MDLGREAFVEHFQIPFSVHCLRSWPKKRARYRRSDDDPPVFGGSIRDVMLRSNGDVSGSEQDFSAAVEPALIALERSLPKGEPPSMAQFAACVYDALDAADLAARIKAPVPTFGEMEGHWRGARTNMLLHPDLTYVHEVRMRIMPASNKLLALSLMAREIARDQHAWWNTHTHTVFASPRRSCAIASRRQRSR